MDRKHNLFLQIFVLILLIYTYSKNDFGSTCEKRKAEDFLTLRKRCFQFTIVHNDLTLVEYLVSCVFKCTDSICWRNFGLPCSLKEISSRTREPSSSENLDLRPNFSLKNELISWYLFPEHFACIIEKYFAQNLKRWLLCSLHVLCALPLRRWLRLMGRVLRKHLGVHLYYFCGMYHFLQRFHYFEFIYRDLLLKVSINLNLK